MQDGLSAPLGSPNQWNFWEKKLNKEISKYVSDVLFKDPFHICQPIKQICAGSSFSGFHRWISLNSKGWPKSVHYRKALWLCLIKVHPGSSLFSTLFCTDLDYIPGWVCHQKKKKPQRKAAAFFCFSDNELQLSSMDFCFPWQSWFTTCCSLLWVLYFHLLYFR